MFLSPSRPVWLYAVVAITAIGLILLWPVTEALSPAGMRLTRLVCALLVIVSCLAVAVLGPRSRPRILIGAAAGVAALAVLILSKHFDATSNCIAVHEGRPLIIGRDYTPRGEEYIRETESSVAADLLLDTGGRADLIWTTASIARCRFWVGWGGLLAVPLFAVAAAALVARQARGVWQVAAARAPIPAMPSTTAARTVLYDAFLSYRRLDKQRAEALVDELESRGFRIAIDFRDFRPNEPVLSEMERCLRESRFLLCLITAHYASSGFTTEEALMAKLLDVTEHRHRIVPLFVDQVPLPAWLQGLVGIDFGPSAQIDPVDKLAALLSNRDDVA